MSFRSVVLPVTKLMQTASADCSSHSYLEAKTRAVLPSKVYYIHDALFMKCMVRITYSMWMWQSSYMHKVHAHDLVVKRNRHAAFESVNKRVQVLEKGQPSAVVRSPENTRRGAQSRCGAHESQTRTDPDEQTGRQH